jgi:hypothetical protein
MSNTENQEGLQPAPGMTDKTRDGKLWKIARKRVAFKKVLLVYIGVNLVEVAVWYFTSGPGSYFWPIWSMLGWGLGLLFQFADAYMNNTMLSEEKEFEKLKNRK